MVVITDEILFRLKDIIINSKWFSMFWRHHQSSLITAQVLSLTATARLSRQTFSLQHPNTQYTFIKKVASKGEEVREDNIYKTHKQLSHFLKQTQKREKWNGERVGLWVERVVVWLLDIITRNVLLLKWNGLKTRGIILISFISTPFFVVESLILLSGHSDSWSKSPSVSACYQMLSNDSDVTLRLVICVCL